MLSGFRSSKLDYTSPDGQTSYIGERARSYFTRIVEFWREIAILCLCILCTVLILERSLTPLGERGRAKIEDYRK